MWEELAKATRRRRERLEEGAASARLLQELRETDREIAAYARRYSVATPDALEKAIRDGRVDGHPAWEDRIDWDNLLAYRARLLAALADAGGRGESR